MEPKTMNLPSKVFCCVAILCSLSGIAHAEISVIALTGQAAPGVTGATFSSFSAASVNNSGEMAFRAELSDGTTGIFKLSHGQLYAVALSGQPIMGSPELSLGTNIGGPFINDSGTIAFTAFIQGGEQYLEGLFVASGISVNKVLDTTDTVPGSGESITSISSYKLNNKSDIAVMVHDSTSGSRYVLVISNGAITSVISVPHASSTSEVAINNKGDIVFGSLYFLYLYSEGMTQPITQPNQSPLWGVTLGTLVINDQKEIFFTNYNQPTSGILLANALFRWRGGVLEQIVSANTEIPGISNASFYQMKGVAIDNSGKVFFDEQFYINNNLTHGLFMYDGGNITLLTQDGQILQAVGTLTEISYTHANDSGTVTFKASLENGTLGIFKLNAYFQMFFPQVADGAYEDQWSWRTTLLLSNPDSSYPASLSIDFIQDDGTPMNVSIQGVTDSQFSFNIPPLGSLQVETKGLGNVKTGWARVQANIQLSGISIYSLYDGSGNYMSEVGAPASSSLNVFSLFVESTADTNTGIALVNPVLSPVDATLTLIDSQGLVLGSSISMTIPAHGHIQRYLTELFQGTIPSDFHGTLVVVSEWPIIGMNLRQRQQVFTWLPLSF
jgi:hypothetical protein